jgi:hypothetical protein
VSVADDYRKIVSILRGWGITVVEWDGCYGRSNGSGWAAGVPIGHVNHHYVCSLNPDQSYIDNLVANLANGETVQWFDDVHGVAYLIGVGPMNHAGTGNQSVLDRTRADQPPPSNPAGSQGSISGNPHYSGTECQHPGDSTPWPGPMLDTMVAINAATFLVFGYSANRAINHSEWSNRKIDMSAGGGVNSDGWSAAELRRRVAARMSGTVPPGGGSGDEDEGVNNGMALSQQALEQITLLLRFELGLDAVNDPGRALGGIREGVKNVVRDEIGPGAISNPDASLNAGIGKRQQLDRAFEFEAVPGYRPIG